MKVFLNLIYSAKETTVRTLFYVLSFIIISQSIEAADFRTVASGNWNSTSTWEMYNGSSWVAASSTPSSSDDVITVRTSNTVTVTSNLTVDQLIIESGATMVIASGKTVSIPTGSGVDLTVNGTLSIAGSLSNQGNSTMVVYGTVNLQSGGSETFSGGATITINSGGKYVRSDASLTTSSGIWIMNSGSTYEHAINGGNLPEATWNTGSICEVTGITNSKPGKLDQDFYNFKWNCLNQNSIQNLGGKLESIAGDFTLVSTGTGAVELGDGENYTLNIGGSYFHQGGTLYATRKSQSCSINVSGDYSQTGGIFSGNELAQDNGKGSPTMNVYGHYAISAGTFDMSQYTGSNSSEGVMKLNLYGNFTQTGGVITETATNSGNGSVSFRKSGTQIVLRSSGTLLNTINFTIVSGSIVDIGTSIFTGNGTFSLNSGGGLIIGSDNGVSASAATGNVQVTGARSFSTVADYTYNGAAAQITGNGLPSTVRNLTINNANGLTLTNSVAASGTLYLENGNVTTGANTLTLGTSAVSTGTLSRNAGHVVGFLRRWIAASVVSDILFPVGTSADYKGMNYSFTTAPGAGGSITVNFDSSYTGAKQVNLLDGSDTIQNVGMGIWNSSAGDGLTGGVFNLDLTATNLYGVTDYTGLRIVSRSNASTAWALNGTNSVATGSNANPVLHRIGMNTHAQFGAGSPGSNVLPITLLFFSCTENDGRVELNWATASEINNEFFVVERSFDGIHFEEIQKVQGAGNSTSTRIYSVEDSDPKSGINYYRLKQFDFDGNYTVSKIKSVNVIKDAEPNRIVSIRNNGKNPFTDFINFSFETNTQGNADIIIINSTAQIVFNKSIRVIDGINNVEIENLNELSPGLYFLNVMMEGSRKNIKLIKH